jgi:hypothetical protein
VCTLAHVFEGLGFATVALTSIRAHTEKIAPPRALYCDFPLGRPLGRPNDPVFQQAVLLHAFGLLEHLVGPVLESFGEAVTNDDAEPVSCRIPPRHDPNLSPAVDEALAIRAAFQRTLQSNEGRTNFGRVLTEQQIPAVLGSFEKIVNGSDLKSVGLPADTTQIAIDLRAYYCEAALSLADSPQAATEQGWSLEHWYHHSTETGRLILAARSALKEQGAPFAAWFYMAPADL